MKKKTKDRQNLNDIGKKYYQFDDKKEKNIYEYACMHHLSKKKLKSLDNSVRFNSYSMWKNYICNKYKDFPNYDLFDFSHFLTQKHRNCQPTHELWNISFPVMLTLLINNIINTLLLSSDIKINGFVEAIIYTITISLIILAFSLLIIKLISIIFDTFTDRDFYSDYKEIIDEMIEERRNKE